MTFIWFCLVSYGLTQILVYGKIRPGIDADQAVLYCINEFIKEEKPFFKTSAEYDTDRLDALLRPSPEDSTELGDVPQKATKGSMDPTVRPYGFMYNYSLVREGNECGIVTGKHPLVL